MWDGGRQRVRLGPYAPEADKVETADPAALANDRPHIRAERKGMPHKGPYHGDQRESRE